MFKTLKFFHQVLAIILILYITAVACAFVVVHNYVHEYNQTLTVSLKKEMQDTAERFIHSEQSRLGALTQSHASWTDLVKHSNDKDTPWIRENATEYLTKDSNFKVEEIYMKNYLNGYTEQFGELPPSVYQLLTMQIDNKAITKKYSSYLVTYKSHLYILTAAALTDSDGKNPSGIYFQGHKIDLELKKLMHVIFSPRADVVVEIFDGQKPHILDRNISTFSTLLVNDLRIKISNVQLVNSISHNTDKLLLLIFAIFTPAVLATLALLYQIALNVKRSLQSIKNITYHDYSQKVTLSVSAEFVELAQCINNLSAGLQKRDQEIESKYFEIISILIKTLEEVDTYTKGHSERVSHYSTDLAKAIGFSDLESIRISGLLHDIGKVTIDSTILNKPGALNAEEFAIIKRHPEIACNILELSDVFQFAKDIVKHHHEKYDGTGYPSGLKADVIPIGARIVAIADVYDALTSARSYRNPMKPEDALAIIIEGSGTHFDPQLVEKFRGIALFSYESWSHNGREKEAEELVEISSSEMAI
ncbi:MAG: HD domain-containing protein [Candidatus Atribacteria bacterium]|nr:MAG: HD domain-containing protein [Candidatus Atribacteria bacterium]